MHTLTGHDGSVSAVAVSADGRRAVSGGCDGTVRVWDLDTGEPPHALTGHDGLVRAVAVSADGRRAVSGGDDGTVRVWDLDTGTAAAHATGHDGHGEAVAVSRTAAAPSPAASTGRCGSGTWTRAGRCTP